MSSPVPTPLPSFVKTGRIVGKSQVVDVDTNTDVDTKPDATYPVGATYEFVPSIDRLIFPAGGVAGPKGYVEYLKAKYTGVVNDTGDIVTQSGGGDFYLPANKAQNNDQDWFWTVTPTVDGRKRAGFRMDITADVDNDITNQMPIPAAAASSAVARGLPGAAGANGAGAPPVGTPNNYVAVSANGATTWVDPATIIGGGGTAVTEVHYDTDGQPYITTTPNTLTIGVPSLSFPIGLPIPAGTAFTVTDSATVTTIVVSVSATPDGVTVNTDGTIVGTPTTAGNVSATVTAEDETGAATTTSVTWSIAAPSNTVTVAFPGNRTKTTGLKAAVQLTATDTLTGAVITWAATGQPAGMAISSSTGLLNGTITAPPAVYNVTVTATDQLGVSGSTSFTFTVTAATATVTIGNPGDQTGTVGTAVNLDIDATTTGAGPISYTYDQLAAGLDMNSATGLITGLLSSAGTTTTTVTATDPSTAPASTATAVFNWLISAPAPDYSITLPARGAVPIGTASYAIPTTNVAFVDPANGVDTAAGTKAAPYKTVAKGISSLAATGGTVVVGVAATTSGNPIIINEASISTPAGNALVYVQNYPGAEVWFEGAVATAGWTVSGSTWVHTGVPTQFYRSGSGATSIGYSASATNSAANLGTDPHGDKADQVFLINNTSGAVTALTQIADNSTPTAGQFSVNYTAGTITIGTNPTGSTVKVGNRRFLVKASLPLFLRGVGVRYFCPDYGSDYTNAAVIFGGTSTIGVGCSDCWFQYTSAGFVGVNAGVKNAKLQNNSFAHLAFLGIAGDKCDGYVFDSNTVDDCNTGGFNASLGGQLAAVKITRCKGLTYRNNALTNLGQCNALWIDVTVTRFKIVHNYVHTGAYKAIHVEESGGGHFGDGADVYSVIAGNTVDGARWGIQIFASDAIKVYNNTLRNCTTEYIDFEQDRDQNDGVIGTHYATNAQCPWLIQDIEVANNTFGPGAPVVKARVGIAFAAGLTVTDSRTAAQMNVRYKTNAWVDATGFQLQWGTGTNNGYTNYTSISTAQTAQTGLVAGNVLGALTDAAATPIHADVAAALGNTNLAGVAYAGKWTSD